MKVCLKCGNEIGESESSKIVNGKVERWHWEWCRKCSWEKRIPREVNENHKGQKPDM